MQSLPSAAAVQSYGRPFRPTDRTHSSRLPIPPIKVHVRLVWNRVFTRPSARGSLRGSTLDLRASIVFYVKPPATT